MELKLATNEKIVKSWDYATSGSSFSKKKIIHHNLTLTNKRVVISSYNDISLDRNELPIDAIKKVRGKFKKNRSFWAYVKLIVGIPLCIVIIGIGMIKSALETLRGASFELELINKNIDGDSFLLGASGGETTSAAKKGFFASIIGLFKKLKPGVKVNVRKEDAKEILDEIGAVILDVQAE